MWYLLGLVISVTIKHFPVGICYIKHTAEIMILDAEGFAFVMLIVRLIYEGLLLTGLGRIYHATFGSCSLR